MRFVLWVNENIVYKIYLGTKYVLIPIRKLNLNNKYYEY